MTERSEPAISRQVKRVITLRRASGEVVTDADGQPVAKGLFTGPATGENTPTFKTRATKPSEKVVTTERTSLLSKAVETFPKRRYRQERQRIRIETAERQGQTLPNGSEIRVPNRESYYRRRQAGSRGSLNEDEKQAFGVGLVRQENLARRRSSPVEQRRAEERENPLPDPKTDLLTWYLSRVEIIKQQSRDLYGRRRGALSNLVSKFRGERVEGLELYIAAVETRLEGLDATLQRLNLDPGQQRVREIITTAVAPLVRHQEIERHRLRRRLNQVVTDGRNGRLLSTLPRQGGVEQGVFRRRANKQERQASHFLVEGDRTVEELSLLRSQNEINRLFNQETASIGRRLRESWSNRRVFAQETTGMRILSQRLKKLEQECGRKIDLSSTRAPDFSPQHLIYHQVEQTIARYVRLYTDAVVRRLEPETKIVPDTAEEFWAMMMESSGDKDLAAEVSARLAVYHIERAFDLHMTNSFDHLRNAEAGLGSRPRAEAEICRVLRMHNGAVAAQVQVQEIRSQRRRLAWLRAIKERSGAFLISPKVQTAEMASLWPTIAYLTEIRLRGGNLGKWLVKGFDQEIAEIEAKEELYAELEHRRLAKIARLDEDEQTRVQHLADSVRRITGLAKAGDYDFVDKKVMFKTIDPKTGRVIKTYESFKEWAETVFTEEELSNGVPVDRALGNIYQWRNFLTAVLLGTNHTDRLPLLFYTPFGEFDPPVLWNSFPLKGELKGVLRKHLQSETSWWTTATEAQREAVLATAGTDFALMDLAALPDLADPRYQRSSQGLFALWLRQVEKHDALRGDISAFIAGESLAPLNVDDDIPGYRLLATRIGDVLGAGDRYDAYMAFYAGLAEPACERLLETNRAGRYLGLLASVDKWVRGQRGFGLNLARTYQWPLGIERSVADWRNHPPTAEEVCRLLFHLCWASDGIRYTTAEVGGGVIKTHTLAAGELIGDYLLARLKKREGTGLSELFADLPISDHDVRDWVIRHFMAFAGLREETYTQDDGSCRRLVYDPRERERLDPQIAQICSDVFLQPKTLIPQVFGYEGLAHLGDDPIYEKLNIGFNRSSRVTLRDFDQFFAIKNGLEPAVGRVPGGPKWVDQDRLRHFFTGDGTTVTERGVFLPRGPLDPYYDANRHTFLLFQRILGSEDWVRRVGIGWRESWKYILTPEDLHRMLEYFRENKVITGRDLEQIAIQWGYSEAREKVFVGQKWVLAVQDSQGKIAGQEITGEWRTAQERVPVVGQLTSLFFIPKSPLEWAVALQVIDIATRAGLGSTSFLGITVPALTIPQLIVGGSAVRLIAGEGLRWFFRLPLMRKINFGCWDCRINSQAMAEAWSRTMKTYGGAR